MKQKKKKKLKGQLLFLGITSVFICILILYLYRLAGTQTIKEILQTQDYWLLVGFINGVILIWYLLMYKIDAQNIVMKENDLEDTEWLAIKKLKKLKEFEISDWHSIKEKNDGIVIGAKKKRKTIEIITTSQLHSLIVGTTGSGKTTGFVDQNIAILAHSKTKPSLIVTDPKKELYEKHKKQLEKEGYQVSMIDLREPYSSTKWNPMNVLIRRIRLVKDLQNNLIQKDGKYYGANETFLSYKDAKARIQELKDEIFENAKDLVYTLCPVQNKDQPTWEEGARNLILGFVLALCEDCLKDEVEEKQLLLFNIYHNITKYCSEDTTVLKQYLIEKREEFSKVKGLVNTVLITSDKTLTSYLSEVNSYMQQLTDDGILALTSESELDIIHLDETPQAVFIVIPDERQTRHRFVTLFITQIYKELVEKANLNLRRAETSTAILKRNVYFILDEFGNLPHFEEMDGMVTVARSRGVRFLFVLQSYSQLKNRYGNEIADIIKSNCNVKIFIGTGDIETRKEFSDLCGQKKIKTLSINTSVESLPSSNVGAMNQPLITTGMLERLNGNKKGDAIISVRGYQPIWSQFTPSYELKEFYFSEGKADLTKKEGTLFEKENYVFDINQKNNFIDERMLDEIDKEEKNFDQYFQDEKEKLLMLDKEWEEVIKRINKKLEQLFILLKTKDVEIIEKASLENKATVLYTLAENYNQTTAQKMQDIADYLTKEALPLLLNLQHQAIK